MITQEMKKNLEPYKESWLYKHLEKQLKARYKKSVEGLVTSIDVADTVKLAVAREVMRETKILAQMFDIEL